MFRRNSNNKFLPARFLTVALAVWLSGMNCLLCCGTTASAETPAAENCEAASECPTSEAGAENAEANGGDNCCSEPHEQSDSTPCEDECCILDSPLSDLPPAPHLIQQSAAPVQPAWSFALCDIYAPPSFQPGKLQLPNQQETYLRCRVFLI